MTADGLALALALAPGPRDPGSARPDPARLPRSPVTRFAPAPTGYLHLGHMVNAIYVWGIARATDGLVLLRIEDHDRQRSRSAFETAILEDLRSLGLDADGAPVRQSADGEPYAAAAASLRSLGRVYACTCSRAALLGWRGPGCPGDCRAHHVPEDAPGTALRADLGGGSEPFEDLLAGFQAGDLSGAGDLTIRDRHGNWSYPLCVVVDDARQGITLVVRGRDLLDATPAQLRLGALLGRQSPPAFLHHPLIHKRSGAKLSKADGDTGIRDLLAGGATPADVLGWAAAAVGLLPEPGPLAPEDLASLFVG